MKEREEIDADNHPLVSSGPESFHVMGLSDHAEVLVFHAVVNREHSSSETHMFLRFPEQCFRGSIAMLEKPLKGISRPIPVCISRFGGARSPLFGEQIHRVLVLSFLKIFGHMLRS